MVDLIQNPHPAVKPSHTPGQRTPQGLPLRRLARPQYPPAVHASRDARNQRSAKYDVPLRGTMGRAPHLTRPQQPVRHEGDSAARVSRTHAASSAPAGRGRSPARRRHTPLGWHKSCTQSPMRKACAWCQHETGQTPSQDETHGICERHYHEMLDQIARLKTAQSHDTAQTQNHALKYSCATPHAAPPRS